MQSEDKAASPTHEEPKPAWVKPEVTDFKPVTVAKSIAYRIGDGISNLS